MTLVLRFHGGAREVVSTREAELGLEGTLDLDGLRARIAESFPALSPYLPRIRFAVNDSFAKDDEKVRPGDVVDLLPPVAGGSPHVLRAQIQREPVELAPLMSLVEDPTAGAVATFLGVVRNHHAGKRVTHLDYEAHETLAPKEMARVLEGVAVDYPDVRIAAAHRIGNLVVGDVAVAVAVSAAHRAEAFDACRAAIDRIKETVPIWKKEWAEDGSAEWVRFEKDES